MRTAFDPHILNHSQTLNLGYKYQQKRDFIIILMNLGDIWSFTNWYPVDTNQWDNSIDQLERILVWNIQ